MSSTGPAAPPEAATTYRYLRLALVVLVVMLAAAVLIEWQQTGRSCLQTSISAYYYTPARPVFVGVLVAIGVCLVALKGSDEREDVLLNVAGMLAPVVAFVPTPDAGTCSSIPIVRTDTAAYVDNNVGALLVAGLVGVLLTVVAVLRSRDRGVLRRRAHRWGTAASVVILLGGAGWFALDRDGFRGAAHYTAASLLFVLIIVVVWLNARGRASSRRPGRRRGPFLGFRSSYAVVAAVMVLGPLGEYLYSRQHPWDHLVLVVESTLIVSFAVFWLLQTRELGELRSRSSAAS